MTKQCTKCFKFKSLDLFYFPTQLEVVNLGGLAYFPICIYLFKQLLKNNTDLYIDN